MADNKHTTESESTCREWLVGAGQGVSSCLSYIVDLQTKLSDEVAGVYHYKHVAQSQIAGYGDLLTKAGVIKEGKVLKRPRLPEEFYAAYLYNIGSAARLAKLLPVTKKITLVNLLDAVIYSIDTGNQLVALTCFRSIIEHIAHFHWSLDRLRKFEIPSIENDAAALALRIDESLAKDIFGGRINWNALIGGSVDDALKKRSRYEYKPEDKRLDRTAEGIMDLIDSLGKKVKHIRGVYEVLCEFAHPNVGTLLIISQVVDASTDKRGVRWVKKEVGPKCAGLIKEMPEYFPQ